MCCPRLSVTPQFCATIHNRQTAAQFYVTSIICAQPHTHTYGRTVANKDYRLHTLHVSNEDWAPKWITLNYTLCLSTQTALINDAMHCLILVLCDQIVSISIRIWHSLRPILMEQKKILYLNSWWTQY